MGVVGLTIGKPWGRRLPVSVGGLVTPFQGADFVMDFANGYYRRGSTVGTTPASIAATVNGGATIDANGLLCDAAGEGVTFDYSIPSSQPFIVVTNYGAQISTAAVFSFYNGSDANSIALYKSGANTTSQSANMLSAAYSASGKVATGFNATQHVVSFGGGAVQKATQTTPDLSSGSKYLGNFASGTIPALVPIRSFAIYLGTFSDAQIQALAT